MLAAPLSPMSTATGSQWRAIETGVPVEEPHLTETAPTLSDFSFPRVAEGLDTGEPGYAACCAPGSALLRLGNRRRTIPTKTRPRPRFNRFGHRALLWLLRRRPQRSVGRKMMRTLAPKISVMRPAV